MTEQKAVVAWRYRPRRSDDWAYTADAAKIDRLRRHVDDDGGRLVNERVPTWVIEALTLAPALDSHRAPPAERTWPASQPGRDWHERRDRVAAVRPCTEHPDREAIAVKAFCAGCVARFEEILAENAAREWDGVER